MNKESDMNAGLMEVNSTFKYTSGGNVQAVWKRHGWVPPSDYREDYLFKLNREAQGEDNA